MKNNNKLKIIISIVCFTAITVAASFLYINNVINTETNIHMLAQFPLEVSFDVQGDSEVNLSGTDIASLNSYDIDEDNETITLISAADSENYLHPQIINNNAYISEYVLTGNKNSGWNGNGNDYIKRNWDMYVNEM